MNDWHDLNPDPHHVARERNRARQLRSTAWWRQQLSQGRCHYCGSSFPPDQLTMDHIIPVARGGRSVKGNVVPACRPCNQQKKHKTPVEDILDSLPPL